MANKKMKRKVNVGVAFLMVLCILVMCSGLLTAGGGLMLSYGIINLGPEEDNDETVNNLRGPGVIRFEAEDAILYSPPDSGNALRLESNDVASGHALVCYFAAGNTIRFEVICTADEANIPLTICASSCVELYENGKIGGMKRVSGGYFERLVKVNGAATKGYEGELKGSGIGDPTYTGTAESYKKEYYNWGRVTTMINLYEGKNIIEIKSTGVALNFDYIEFETQTAQLSWTAVNNY